MAQMGPMQPGFDRWVPVNTCTFSWERSNIFSIDDETENKEKKLISFDVLEHHKTNIHVLVFMR